MKMQKVLLGCGLVLLAACGGENDFDIDNNGGQSGSTTSSRIGASSSAGNNGPETVFLDDPIAQPPASIDLEPAFAGQTRALAMQSGYEIQIETILSDLINPWGLVFLPDGRLLVTEKSGAIRLVNENGTHVSVGGMVDGVANTGQGGLLDIVLSPTFEQDSYVYFSYVARNHFDNAGDLTTRVVRAKFVESALAGASLQGFQEIFVQTYGFLTTVHFGSRLAWSEDGDLFITLGDRGREDEAQKLSNTLGVVVRIEPDGNIPEDNPFVTTPGADPAIWSYGHRNVQGAAIHPDTGELWTIEHGPQGGDELNITEAGNNYGWPVITYGAEYGNSAQIGVGGQQDGMEQPVYYWNPSIAPSSMIFYTGDMFEEWQGDILITGLASQLVARLRLEETPDNVTGYRVIGEEHLAVEASKVRALTQAPDGSIWWITDEGLLRKMTVR